MLSSSLSLVRRCSYFPAAPSHDAHGNKRTTNDHHARSTQPTPELTLAEEQPCEQGRDIFDDARRNRRESEERGEPGNQDSGDQSRWTSTESMPDSPGRSLPLWSRWP